MLQLATCHMQLEALVGIKFSFYASSNISQELLLLSWKLFRQLIVYK